MKLIIALAVITVLTACASVFFLIAFFMTTPAHVFWLGLGVVNGMLFCINLANLAYTLRR